VLWVVGAMRPWATCQTRMAPVTMTTTAVRRIDVATVVAEALFSVGELPVAPRARGRAKVQVLSARVGQKEDS